MPQARRFPASKNIAPTLSKRLELEQAREGEAGAMRGSTQPWTDGAFWPR